MQDWQTRIEKKIDDIYLALNRLTVMEERVYSQGEGLKRLGGMVDEMERVVRKLELSDVKSGVSIGAFERFAWIVITGSIGLVFYIVKLA